MKSELRKQAVAWINSPARDFHTGITILLQTGFKPAVVAKLNRVGPTGPEAPQRLNYLIREFVSVFGQQLPEDTDPELHIFSGHESPQDTPAHLSRAILAVAERTAQGTETPPPNIARVIRQYAKFYKQRDRACNQLAQLPENNTPDIILQRKQLSDSIEQTTTLLEKLYPLYEQYLLTGQDILLCADQVETPHGEPSGRAQHPESTQSSQQAAVLPSQSKTALASLTVEQLRHRRRLLATKRTRASNMLQYQTETRQPQPNPMPESPAKVRYTNKLNSLNKQIEDIDYAIAEKTA